MRPALLGAGRLNIPSVISVATRFLLCNGVPIFVSWTLLKGRTAHAGSPTMVECIARGRTAAPRMSTPIASSTSRRPSMNRDQFSSAPGESAPARDTPRGSCHLPASRCAGRALHRTCEGVRDDPRPGLELLELRDQAHVQLGEQVERDDVRRGQVNGEDVLLRVGCGETRGWKCFMDVETAILQGPPDR